MKAGMALPQVAKENTSARAAIGCAMRRKAVAQTKTEASGTVPDGGTNVRATGRCSCQATPISLGKALRRICNRIAASATRRGSPTGDPFPVEPSVRCVSPAALFGSAAPIRRLAHEHGREASRLSAHFVFFVGQISRARRRRPGEPIAASKSRARFSSANSNPTLR